MLRFANTYALHLFWLIPAVLVFYILVFRAKTRALQRFGSSELMKKLAANASRTRPVVKAALILLTLLFGFLALARPQIGTRVEEVKREGIDIMIAIDVSTSMMAEDIPPSRLEKAKHEVESLLGRLQGDRVGLIAFSGIAFVQCPLTLDYGAAKLFLDILDPGLIPTPGTNIGQAIAKALESFDPQERKHKVLVIITDGEDHEGDVMKQAEEAERQGVIIYTVGIGSPKGDPIPVITDYGVSSGFKKDREGQVVITKLDEVTLEKIALQTNGKYFRASSGEDELRKIYDDIDKLEKKELGSMRFSQFEDRFQYVLIVAILLLSAELFIPERRQRRDFWLKRLFKW
jgi:Ca-activated chloride channel family protein